MQPESSTHSKLTYAARVPDLGPGPELDEFVEGLLVRLTSGSQLLEHAKQLTIKTSSGLSPEDFRGKWFCNTSLWLGVPCTPEIVRGLCAAEEKNAFLQQLVDLAGAVEATPLSSRSLSHHSSIGESGPSGSRDEIRASSQSTTSTSSDRPASRPPTAAPHPPSSQAAALLQLQMLAVDNWASFMPAHLPLFPQDIVASLDMSSMPPEQMAAKVAELRSRVEALQDAAAPAGQGRASGADDSMEQAAALGQLEASLQSFMAASEQFRRWCKEEVGVWGRLGMGPPAGELGGAAEQLVLHQRRLQQALDSLEALRLLHQQLGTGEAGAAGAQGGAGQWLLQLASRTQASVDALSFSHARLCRQMSAPAVAQ